MNMNVGFNYHKNGEWIRVYSPDELCKIVKDSLGYYHDKMLEQKERGDRTMEEAEQRVRDYRDKKLQEMEDKVARSYIEFNSLKEKERFNTFAKIHEECSSYLPMIQVWGCGVGIGYKLKCAGCGEEEDITDVEAW